MASPSVGSPITSCQVAIGSWLVFKAAEATLPPLSATPAAADRNPAKGAKT
jgi:hypothetical protein